MISVANTERPLPRSIEAERGVIAALIVRGSLSNDAIAQLSPADFTGSHQALFGCVRQMILDGIAPDLVLLKEKLHLQNAEIAAVASMIDGVPLIRNDREYVQIVKQKALLRDRILRLNTVQEMLLNANGNAREVLDLTAEMLSAHLKGEVGQKRILRFFEGPELAEMTTEKVDWAVRAFLAKGTITELGAKVKMGKTTWTLHLARAALDGFDFMGEPTSKTPVIYLTEQPPVSFRQAMERAGLTTRKDFLVLLHSGVHGVKWPEIAHEAIAKCKSVGAGLLIVDTLPQFAGLTGEKENNSGDALEAMQPLQQAAAEGIAVILVRRERKSGGDVGDSGRGSSAFAGAVDVVLSLRRPEGHSRKTVRVLQALSRFSDTPPELLIELTERGYVSLGAPNDAALKESRESILAIAPKTEAEAIPLKELSEMAKSSRVTAQRAIEELQRDGVLGRIGKGKKGDPFRYFLAEIPFCPTSYIYGQKETILDPPEWATEEG